MSEGSEHIAKHYLATDDPDKPPEVKPRYKSKFAGNMPPSWSTFNNKTTAHNGVNNVNGDVMLHGGYQDFTANHAFWGPQKGGIKAFEKQNPMKLATGNLVPFKCRDSQHKVDIAKHIAFKPDENKLIALKEKHRDEKLKRCKSALPKTQTAYVDKSCFGKVPQYLQEMKTKNAADEKIRLDALKPPPKQKMSRSQIEKIREGLLQQQKALVAEYSNFTHKDPDGIKLKRRKVELEHQLTALEKDLAKLNGVLGK